MKNTKEFDMATKPLDEDDLSDEEMRKLIRANSIFIYLLERESRRSTSPYAIPQPVASGKAPEGGVSSPPVASMKDIPWRKRVVLRRRAAKKAAEL